MVDTDPILKQIEAAEAEMKRPLPTPPVGYTVVWYDRADKRDGAEIAAIVTKVEGPGKLTVTTFRPQGMPDPTRRGCLHATHKLHDNRHNTVSRNSGSWDYPQGVRAPKEHFKHHMEQLEAKVEMLQGRLEDAEKMNAKASGDAGSDGKGSAG
jgi:hypothetical protein